MKIKIKIIIKMAKTGSVFTVGTPISIKSLNRIAVIKKPAEEAIIRADLNQFSGRLALITDNKLMDPNK